MKFFIILLGILGQFNHPHIHRQTDTLGVGLRYNLQWKYGNLRSFSIDKDIEHPKRKYINILPQILQSGENLGIMPMEFPLLNLVTGAIFYLSPNYTFAIFVARLFLILILIFIYFKLYQEAKNLYWGTISIQDAIKWSLIIGVSAVYFDRFIPDVLSVSLTLWATLILLKNNIGKTQIFKFFGLMLIGLLIKPTSIISIFILLFFKNKLRNLVYLFLPIILTVSYYLFVNNWIDGFREIEPLFKTEIRNPIFGAYRFWTSFKAIFYFFNKSLIFNYSLIIIPMLFLIQGYFLKPKDKTALKDIFNRSFFEIIFILFLQITFMSFLDGDHSLRHHYYFVGTSILTSLIFVHLWHFAHHYIRHFIFLFLIFIILDRGSYYVKYFLQENELVHCQNLKNKTPFLPWNQFYAFMTVNEKYPFRGLCFGEITNAKQTEYFLAYKNDSLPKNRICSKIDQEASWGIYHCPMEKR